VKLLDLSGAPIAIAAVLQTYFAAAHSKKRWDMISSLWKNWQEALPIHLLLSKLSFVAIALCQINHSHIFIFRGILLFHRCLKDL
jgi:phosphate/sulfate permease